MSQNQKTRTFLLCTAIAALAVTLVGSTSVDAGEVRPFMTLEMAKKMADACEAYQEEQNLPKFNIAVVDRGADLVLFRRQDDAWLGSGKIALQKAHSSASIPVPTRTIAEIVYGTDGTPPAVPGLAHSDVVAFAGGLPIAEASGALVGAIGVSGGSADQDEECAKAAVAAIADELN
jgi:uncharacterized protein GlcG (DUF336 family)